MDKIRVKVKLTNAFDEAYFRRGKINKEEIRSYEAEAIVNVNKHSSTIPQFVMKKLEILPFYQRVFQNEAGDKIVVDVTEPITFEIIGTSNHEAAIVMGGKISVGRIALAVMDLKIDNQCLIPNSVHPDQLVVKIK